MSSLPAAAVERLPFRDPTLDLDKRIDDLLRRLAFDERLAMLHQYAPAIPRLGVAAFRTGSEALHGVAWLGVATVFPQAVGLGATWDEDLVRRVAEAVSTELRAFHYHRPPTVGTGANSLQAWAPVVNLLRDPRWGRNEEGYSEDPVHTSRLAVAYCRGLAGDHPTFLRTAPVVKHFLAYNNEDDRCVTSSAVRARVLQEYDLAAFRPVVESGAVTGAMAAYNLVNGRPCHVSPLIETELRYWADHELFVVSDAEAPSNLVDVEHYFDDHAQAHAAALRAGIDSFTDHGEDSDVSIGRLREALRRGLIGMSDVDRAVRRQLLVRFRLGEFDPSVDPYASIGPDVIDCAEHRELALRSATESVVLLRNEGLLPLDAARAPRIAVIGPLADTLCEDWYSGTMPYRITVAAGLAERLGKVSCVDGSDRVALRSRATGELLGGMAFDVVDWGGGAVTLRSADTGRYLSLQGDNTLVADKEVLKSWEVRETFRLEADGDLVLLRSVLTGRYAAADGTVTAETPEDAERWHREVLRDGVAAARAAAEAADVAVVVLGNHPMINGRETEDRADIALPAGQEALLRNVAEVRPATSLVVMSSYPYALDWAEEHLPAVVWMSHGGQESGRALAAVLLGEADPAGRLPQTWYRGTDILPDPLDYDVIKAGWTYQYHWPAPLYPFGHGLSYTEFEYRDVRLSTGAIGQHGSVEVSLTVANTGARAGTDVVQLYVRARDARYEAPRLRLADFAKIRLGAGESQDVAFRLPAERLAHWDVAIGDFTVDPGSYEVLVARSAEDVVLSAPLTVAGPAPEPRAVVDRRTAAADFDDYAGIDLVDESPTAGDAVAAVSPNVPAQLWFRSVDLTGSVRVEAEVARAGDEGPCRLEFRAGGRLLAAVPVPVTGHRHAWTTVTAELPARLTGVHDLTLSLRGPFRLAAFRFRS
ncbi:glycoside hydrolase family 3 protein [Kutzneria sp. CA-103260]|uniref:glycoside hydrolase family 3 protein n=1 Tax=Kutzneria sp. CA-103260 TaxID=2802641 RepID=UPI001BA61576|nr:glycoside hydrolase family 3 protein [Kutzneria sp. CA-103260]QUQ65468.1 carbohydrate-binding protein [Kutzneria sp. CA-103260]